MYKVRGPVRLSLILMLALACIPAGGAVTEEHYYAIEINGTLCGYAHVQMSDGELDGEPTTLLEQRMFMMLSALGNEVNTEILLTYHLDPATGEFVFADTDITQGRTKLGWTAKIEGDTARITSLMKDGETTVALAPDVIRGNPLYMPHLRRDFVDRSLQTQTYRHLEVPDAEIQESTYTLAGTEELELAGRRFDAVVLDAINEKTGVKSRLWIDRETGQVLKGEVAGNRVFYLADASVAKKIQLVDVDQNIIRRVDVSIPDIQSITHMKVRATIEPSGQRITPESLNVPGQRFSGTVEENRIEGIFEIEHVRYDGAGAPPFPPDFTGDEAVRPYLEAQGLIESNDPVLIDKAREITRGAEDSWEAVRLLSAWVAENIDYAIPGGRTARRTYDTRTGECGSHSNLVAALCRAVGIPARVVWGAMYVPNLGGAFGQHAWNEVYMGDAGWIPLDATANEPDYVDSGHIRIGVHESVATALNPVEFEVLDHRLGTGEVREVVAGQYDPYLGEYTHAQAPRTLRVLVRDGALAVEIPDQTVLALNDPDEHGVWYAKLTNLVFVTFRRNEQGRVDEMQLHQIVRMQRTADPEQIDPDVPERFRPYLGKYLLAPLNAEFTVTYREGSLAVEDPIEKVTVGLQLPDESGRWVDEFDKNTIWFEREQDGVFKTMVVDSANTFGRVSADSPEQRAVKAALSDFHRAAAEADGERLFGYLADDAILFGTAGDERFTVEEYRAFIEPHLSQGIGSTSVPVEQNVFVSDDGKTAWFDERITKPGLGELRGTGVMRKVDGSWKLVQFNLAFTVPNELAGPLAEMIRDLRREEP